MPPHPPFPSSSSPLMTRQEWLNGRRIFGAKENGSSPMVESSRPGSGNIKGSVKDADCGCILLEVNLGWRMGHDGQMGDGICYTLQFWDEEWQF